MTRPANAGRAFKHQRGFPASPNGPQAHPANGAHAGSIGRRAVDVAGGAEVAYFEVPKAIREGPEGRIRPTAYGRAPDPRRRRPHDLRVVPTHFACSALVRGMVIVRLLCEPAAHRARHRLRRRACRNILPEAAGASERLILGSRIGIVRVVASARVRERDLRGYRILMKGRISHHRAGGVQGRKPRELVG
jgi:hypothetical protein